MFLISSKSASHSSTLLVQCITAFGLCFFNYPAFFQRSLQVRRGSPKVSQRKTFAVLEIAGVRFFYKPDALPVTYLTVSAIL